MIIEITKPGYNPSNPARTAVRAVIVKDGLLFLMHLKKSNTFVLPGGSVDQGETLENALKREVLEETGYTVCSMTSTVIIKELHESINRVHHFYLVKINNESHATALTEEEITLGMTLKMYPVEDAIALLSDCIGTHELSEPIQLREFLGVVYTLNLYN